MTGFGALPTALKGFIIAVPILIVIGLLTSSGSPESRRTATGLAPLDDTTLFNSVARVFVTRYNYARPAADGRSELSPESRTFCEEGDHGARVCELPINVPIFTDTSWVYEARVDKKDCWRARLSPRFGPFQHSIDAYRARQTFAPSTAEVRALIGRVNALRVLTGCASNVRRPAAGAAPDKFMTAFAAQNVQRERPGTQRFTTCTDLGKQEIDFGPDSWRFNCTTTMASGKRYEDKFGCFDGPPYTSLDSCVEERGYPKRPPRHLPGS